MNGGNRLETTDLNGARILLIAPRFFNYDRDIRQELERRGASVDFLADRPFTSPVMHGFAKVAPSAVQAQTRRYYREAIEEFGPAQYDYVFVLNGQTVSSSILRELRERHGRATFLLYIWDAIANRPKVPEILPLFDRTYTFEPEAAIDHAMRFRPLFFADRYGENAPGRDEPERWDISFVGTAHTGRHRVVRDLDRTLPASVRRFWFLYLQARWVLYARRLTDPVFKDAKPSDFTYEPLPPEEGARIFWQSRAVLDIEHPAQTGLTIRTFETMGAGKKLVSTNRHLSRYAFFDPERIAIIDRDAPAIPEGFLGSPAKRMEPEILDRYSLTGWTDEIFSPGDHSSRHLTPGAWTRAPLDRNDD